MTKAVLSARHFHDEEAAYAYVEARLWKDGRDCPHCGVIDNSAKLTGKSTRIGVYKCRACRKPFTVKVGTIFESSHVKLHIWLQAIHLLASSKKGFSANQFARTLGVSLKAAWFMAHRIREAMRSVDTIPFGKAGGAVESDETFFGQNPEAPVSRTPIRSMNAVLTLIDRESGAARSIVLDGLSADAVGAILHENVAKEARLMTDDAPHYRRLGKEFAEHGSVRHAQDEYVSRDDPSVHTQTVENYYSVFKRGMKGTYQHCARRHLHRYCAEFDFRYSNRVALGVDDQTRADRILAGVKGKRLTYGPTDSGRTRTVTA
ncbi:MAG: IS1595 family transposase [Hyphomonadaceae bacterium]